MKSFFSFLISNRFPSRQRLGSLFEGPLTLSKSIFYGLFIGLLIVIYVLLITLNNTLLVTVPARGGTLTEGIIGAPRFINPVLASNDTDMALTSLIYAGVMKEYGDGSIVPELAQSYNISPDGRTYTFTLRDKLTFHDGSALTSSDVAFTIEKFQNSAISANSSSWQDISVSTPNESTVVITLLAPDDSFLKQMTVGVLPSAQWQGVIDEAFVDPSLNLSPIGAGAFKVKSVSFDELGAPKELELRRNNHYALGAPLLSSLTIKVFSNQSALFDALKDHSIDFTFNLSPQSLPEGKVPSDILIESIPTQKHVELLRRSGESSLGSASLLAIINQFIDKKAIVATVENGYGIPFGDTESTSGQAVPLSLEEAQSALIKLGYSVENGVLSKGGTPVALGIASRNDPELTAAARSLSGQMASLGVISEVRAFDPGTFQDELDAGVFALILTDDADAVTGNYEKAIPLYTTAHLAALGPNVHDIAQNELHFNSLRYANSTSWHTRTDQIWKWFISKEKRTITEIEDNE